MLNLNCVICAELFKAADDAHVTSCGHMFHITCLAQWLQRSKTCPQCRNKCSDRSITRVYFNLSNLDCTRIDIASLQEQLENAELKLKMKEKELQNANNEINSSKKTQKKCMKTIGVLEKELQSKSFLIHSYVEKTEVLQSQVKLMEGLRKECRQLKEQIEAMDGVNTLLTATMSDADKILNNEKNPKILSSWVATLKRELKMCESKKADMRNILRVVQSNLRKEVEHRQLQEERNAQLESDNYQLLEKIKCLEASSEKNNTNIDLETSADKNIGLKPPYYNSARSLPKIKEEKRATLSPTIKDSVKKIEKSSSPYLNIKSCSVLLPPILMKNPENRIGSNTTTVANKFTVLKISPTKTGVGAIRKTRSDLTEKYSILKKPRMELMASSGSSVSTMKPLTSNFVFNGFGGSERVNPFDRNINSDEESDGQTEAKQKHVPVTSISSRLRTGGLRNIKLTK